jgi:hypothetical protein
MNSVKTREQKLEQAFLEFIRIAVKLRHFEIENKDMGAIEYWRKQLDSTLAAMGMEWNSNFDETKIGFIS